MDLAQFQINNNQRIMLPKFDGDKDILHLEDVIALSINPSCRFMTSWFVIFVEFDELKFIEQG